MRNQRYCHHCGAPLLKPEHLTAPEDEQPPKRYIGAPKPVWNETPQKPF